MTPQETLAHYRITSKLGEGGMGAVYRATDTKLNREVAIKVLPETLATDPDRAARFKREAQLLASLNHPNIAAIYGVEERAIVLELVEGAELRGPLPEAEALPVLTQLIDALEYAHERGVVHRDLKPANLKLTPDGRLKVLDFGLAKAIAGEAAAAVDPASSPTMTMRATMAGVIMGTAAYMAPEQARGHNVDKRADIWAFGVVAYELLTGRQLFGGETVSDILASVLRDEPDFSLAPPRFQRLLRLCLTRDPHRRLRDISGARLLLDDPVLPAVPAPPPRRTRLPWIVAGGCALVVMALTAAWLTRRPAESGIGPARFVISFPEQTSLPTSAAANQWVPSPDGRMIALVTADVNGKGSIWLRSLNDLSVHRLDKTDGAELPFWSPDGKSLAFFADARLKRLDLAGGSVQTICDLPLDNKVSAGDGGAWNQDDQIVFSVGRGYGLFRVSAAGGKPETLTQLRDGEVGHSSPQFLPGRRLLYYARAREAANSSIYVQDLGSANRIQVMKSLTRAVWAPPGYLLFTREGALFAQAMNLNTAHLEGQPVPLQEDVVSNGTNGRSTVSVSQNGMLVYRSGRRTGDRQLTWRDPEGKMLGQIGSPTQTISFSLSPDERSLAMINTVGAPGAFDAWVMDIATGVTSQMTHDGKASRLAPVWSPDSKRIAISTGDDELLEIEVASARITPHPKTPCQVQDWSSDGSSILCATYSGGRTRVFVLPLAGEGPGQTILDAPYSVVFSRFSPDGKFIAYTSYELGNQEIYVSALPPAALKRRVSTDGGAYPIWAHDPKKLFYRTGQGKLMVVDIRTGSDIEVGLPKPLFAFGAGSSGNRFAVAGDGRRFVISEFTRRTDIDRPEINVVLNWTDALRK